MITFFRSVFFSIHEFNYIFNVIENTIQHHWDEGDCGWNWAAIGVHSLGPEEEVVSWEGINKF